MLSGNPALDLLMWAAVAVLLIGVGLLVYGVVKMMFGAPEDDHT